MDNSIIILIAIISIITIYLIVIYNRLQKIKFEVENAFGGMDVQLKKRYDLIPNLVQTVKNYLKHEKDLLTQITELRTQVTSKDLSDNEKVKLDNKISSTMGNIMVAVENYPNLKANESFEMLQRSLNEVESQISAARRTFNSVITDYNTSIKVFPQNLIANAMKLTLKDVFEIPEEQRKNININNLFKN